MYVNFFMFGDVVLCVKKVFGILFVMMFYVFGCVWWLYQGMVDGFFDVCFVIEDMFVCCLDCLIVECLQDVLDLMMYYCVDIVCIEIVLCGFDVWEFWLVLCVDVCVWFGWLQDVFVVL